MFLILCSQRVIKIYMNSRNDGQRTTICAIWFICKSLRRYPKKKTFYYFFLPQFNSLCLKNKIASARLNSYFQSARDRVGILWTYYEIKLFKYYIVSNIYNSDVVKRGTLRLSEVFWTVVIIIIVPILSNVDRRLYLRLTAKFV